MPDGCFGKVQAIIAESSGRLRAVGDLKVAILLGRPNPGPTGGTILLRTPATFSIKRILVAPDGRFAKLQTNRKASLKSQAACGAGASPRAPPRSCEASARSPAR